jgi:hypothetical protein
MVNGSVVTDNGKNMLLYRGWTPNASLSATANLAPTKFKISKSTPDPNETDTALTTVLPIANGTVLDDGTHNFTGAFGGATSSDNAVTYKEGGGVTDNTAQDLNTNTSSRAKVWTYVMAGGATATQYCGFWLYIKDAATLAKFNTLTSVYSIQLMLGDGAGNDYYQNVTTASLITGWNWLDLGIINTWSSDGVPATLDNLQLQITTNYDTDTFAVGDVIFDLLRTWTAAQTLGDFETGYPSFNTVAKEVAIYCYLDITEANGYLIDGAAIFNQDSSPLMSDKCKFTAESKSSTDAIYIVFVNRIR